MTGNCTLCGATFESADVERIVQKGTQHIAERHSDVGPELWMVFMAFLGIRWIQCDDAAFQAARKQMAEEVARAAGEVLATPGSPN